MDTPDLFRVGDRVQLIVPFEDLSWGRSGVIRWVYFPVEAYRVLFDDEQVSRLVYGPDLVGEPPERAREVSA
jgi:hypothetical protein